MPTFSEIQFGFASAESEAANAPELLLSGYYDHADIVSRMLQGDEYLVLGPKGAGKSAIGEKLKLIATSEPTLFVSHYYLADFPYNAFKKISTGDLGHEESFPATWKYLLLLKILDSLRRDNGATSRIGRDFADGTQAIRELGLLPVDDLKSLVMRSTKKTFKAQIPKLLEATTEATYEGQDIAFLQFNEYLWRLVGSIVTSSRHLIVIDGLDDILTRNHIQYESLAALVLEVSRINSELKQRGTPAKVVLLMRTDLYEKLPGPNKNKMRQDAAITIDWYHDTRNPDESALLDLLNLRAALSGSREMGVLDEFFPTFIDNSTSVSYLLDLTRHTPRDVIQLMRSIQGFAASTVEVKLDRDVILNGARKYSIEYLLPEIKDELVGFIPQDHIEAILNAISSLRSRDFRLSQVIDAAEVEGGLTVLETKGALQALYECSAIGTVHNQHGASYYTFKYRSPHSSLSFAGTMLLHRGIWKAMNVA